MSPHRYSHLGSSRRAMRYSVLALFTAGFLILGFPSVAGAAPSNQYVLMSQFGRQVNQTQTSAHAGEEKENFCEAKTTDTCQPGVTGNTPGAFNLPTGIAVGPETTGSDIYVAEQANGRVQVFSSSEKFLFMLGWEVNQTTKENICTQADITKGDKCQAGQDGGGQAGELSEPMSVTADQTTGDFYVFDRGGLRVVKYDPEGHFIWMIGENVDKTKTQQAGTTEAERNICTAASGDTCQAGAEPPENSKLANAFSGVFGGDLVTIGGPTGQQALYVGDQARVQKINPETGAWIGEVSLGALPIPEGYVKALAVDQKGNLYVVEAALPGGSGEGVNVLDATGKPLGIMDAGVKISAIAIDSFGRLAVTETAEGKPVPKGTLFSVETREKLSKFHTSFSGEGVAFSPDANSLYVASGQMIEQLLAVPVAEPVTEACKNRAATSATLVGTVKPKGVNGTQAWFLYGSGLELETPKQPIATSSPEASVEATATELRPNEAYPYTLAAEDENEKPKPGEEPLVGKSLICETLYIPPMVGNEVQSYEAGFSSVDLYGELNPENANTIYAFQYGACNGLPLNECSSVHETPALETSEYRTLGVMQTAAALQPGTKYQYRLIAKSKNRTNTEETETKGKEGEFTTLSAPNPTAATNLPGSVTASTAVLNGVVSGGGAAAAYSFEAGVYNGPNTVYGTVVTEQITGEGTAEKSYLLTGLQSGTTYAYRVTVSSPYILNATHKIIGSPVLFTTSSLPPIFTPPPSVKLLPSPLISFPRVASAKHKTKHKAKKTKKTKSRKKGKKAAIYHRKHPHSAHRK